MARIFISAGHSTQDPGATSALRTTEAREMMQTRDLIIAELTARGLQEGQDFFSASDAISLSRTIGWINERAVRGDVALEIHGNAVRSHQARGTECFYIAGNQEREQNARLMVNSLCNQVPELRNHGAKPDTASQHGSLGFCRNIAIPSLLLELCFIDNRQDLDLLHSQRQDFARGIVDGLIAWSRISPNGRGGNGSYPTIDIELGGQRYEDRGILVNNNAFIPIDLVDRLGIDVESQPNVREESYGGVVYVKAVDLQPFNVLVSWDARTRTVILDPRLTTVEIDRIMGEGLATAEQLSNFLKSNNSGQYVTNFIDNISPNLAELYVEEAAKEGVNHDIAFCQMCLETGYLRFDGDVSHDQNNFCGLGAVGGGASGAQFVQTREGVKAHIQHLKAYASTDPINDPNIVDPRFHLVTRGIAPKVQDLSRRWATDPNYGDKILAIMRRFYESAGIDPYGNHGSELITITSPRSTWDLNTMFVVEGTATNNVAKVLLSSPYGENIFPLATADVNNGQWHADVRFTIAGTREIIATGLDADDNVLELDPAELTVIIQSHLVQPVRGGYVTSRFGRRNGRNHRGTDIGHRDRERTPIYAIADGIVNTVQIGCRVGNYRCGGGFGNYIDIRHEALGYLSRYAHLTRVNVNRGDQIIKGDVIGIMGNTGHSTGPHLHIEIRQLSNNVAVNPESLINPIT